MFPTKFRFIWPNGYRREEFLKSANQKQESPMIHVYDCMLLKKMFFCAKGDNSNLNIDISKIQLAKN
jgi:hypothetical protein